MKNKLVVSFAVLLGLSALLPARASAQEAELEQFQQTASSQSVLYRGRAARLYSNALYNGHYFWQTKEFRTGSVLYNGKFYTGVLLNIDACASELLVKINSSAPAIVVTRDLVTEFEIDGEKFVNLKVGGQADAREGFYQVACENPLVYHRVDKNFTSSASNVNGAAIGYDDPDYRNDVLNYFMNEERWYVVKDGKLKRIGRRKALKTINAANNR